MNAILFVGEHLRTYNVQRHTHDYWELVYCTGGQGEFRLEDGTVIPYGEGDMVAIPPGVVHMNYSEDGFTNIHLTMDEPSYPYRTAFRVSDDLENHLRRAFIDAKFYYLADIVRREILLAAFGDLISSYVIVFRSNSEYSAPVERIRTEIMKNYSNPDFQLEEVLRAMPFHYDYLRKIFKKEMGDSPLGYMTGLRMKKAEVLLTSMWCRDYSMAEIAEMCGFDDALYFSRVFKKHFGCSPSAFAKHSERQNPEQAEAEVPRRFAEEN